MNARTKDCDHRRIDDFLTSDHVGLEDDQLMAHLNTCATCREYMETQAADSDSWNSAAVLLQPGEFDHASSIEYSLATIGSGRVDPPAAIQGVLDLLMPSEDPSRLGRLGTYEVSGVIGAGGMGVVLKAVDPSLDRVVAIKVMAPHLANNATARKRFSREAKAAAAVLHPNVIPIHSVSSNEKTPYLVMAYIRGGSLQKRLDREGPLATVEILRIGSQVAAGLAAAHEQGLVHRDVKPENILLEEGVERITLTDFGLARAVDDASVTREGTIAGTPQYMSPEQTRGEPVDQQSDLFSLGCVLYSLCAGRPPFRAESSYAVMRKISDEEPMPIRELNPEIPEWLCAIVRKLMAKKKAERFTSAHEVHELLEACLSHVQQPTTNPLPGNLIKSRQPQFTAVAKTLIGVSSMLIITTAIWLLCTLWMGAPPSEPATSAASNEEPAASTSPNASEDEQVAAISQKEARLKKLVEDNPIVVRVKLENGRFTGVMHLHIVQVLEAYKGKADDVRSVFAHATVNEGQIGDLAKGGQPRIPQLVAGEYVMVLEANPVTNSFAISSFGLRVTPEPSFNYVVARDGNKHAAWPVGSLEARQVLNLCGAERPGQVIVRQPFAIHVHKDTKQPAQLKDGDYALQITHTAKHPKVQFPTDLIPETEYKKADEPPSAVRFSDNLKTLKLVGYGGIGGLESRAGDTLVYTLDRGLDASGSQPAQVVVKQTENDIAVTLTQFGSGVPIIVSHKGVLTETTGKHSSTQPDDNAPLTWKSLLGKEPPKDYSTEALSLIEALNNSRGEWIVAGKLTQEKADSEFDAAMEIQGGFKNMIKVDSFPQWQIVIAWPRDKPTHGLVLNVMALPEPTGIKWMLAPQYSSKDGGPIPSRHKMYEGSWNPQTATLTWTSKHMRPPLKKDDAVDEPNEPKAIFEMIVKRNGEIQFTGYQHTESLVFSGKAAARVGEPYVEEEPALKKLPGGYKLFFASRLEVCLDSESGPIIAGPRIEKIGCDGNLIFGLIAKYVDAERSDTPGYFWLDATTGKITKGMEVAAWREVLKSKGVSEPRLFAPESVGEQ